MNDMFLIGFESGHSGIINSLGQEIVPFSRENSFGAWAEGRALAKLKDSLFLMTENTSFIPLEGMTVPTQEYPWFSEGLMPMSAPDDRVGYIDRNGAWAIKPSFDTAMQFREGLAIVTVNGLTQLINRRGVVIRQMTSLYLPWSWSWPEDMWCFAARHYSSDDQSDSCLVCGFESIIPFPDALQITDPYQGILGVQTGEREWVLCDYAGTTQTARKWHNIFNFSCGLAVAVSENGLYGAIDPAGRWKIRPVFESLATFRFGWSIAEQGSKKSVIDTSGRPAFTLTEGSAYIESDHIVVFHSERTEILELDGCKRWSFRSPA